MLAAGQGAGRGADLVRQPRQVAGHPRVRDRAQNQTADKQAMRDFVFAKRRRDVRHAGEPARRATKLQEWAKKGYFTQELQRHRLRPGLAAVRQGQGPVPDRRHVGHRRPRRSRWATSVGFMLMPARGRRRSRSRSAARACRSRSPRSPRTPTSRPPTSTSSPTPNAAKVLVETDNLPAMKATRRRRRRPVRRTSPPPGRSSTTPTALIAVPGLHDADVLRRHLAARVQELLAGKQDAGRVHEGRAGGLRRSARESR